MAFFKAAALTLIGLAFATSPSLASTPTKASASAGAKIYEGRLDTLGAHTLKQDGPPPILYELTVGDESFALIGLQFADTKNLVPNDLGGPGEIKIEARAMPGNRNVLSVTKVLSFDQPRYEFDNTTIETSKALVMVLNFGDDTNKMDKANEYINDVAKAYRDNSWGKKQFITDVNKDGKPDVIGPIKVTSTKPRGPCFDMIWADKADKVAKEKYGLNLADYNHRIYFYDTYLKCGWEGLGYVGCTKNPEGKCRTYMNTENPRHQFSKAKAIWVHELGHNLGLRHARKGKNEYGDKSDPMGTAKLIHFNGAHSDKLGYLEATPGSVKDAENLKGTSVTLHAMTESSTDGLLKVIRFGKVSEGADLYYAQLRSMKGIDVQIEDDDYYDKVLVHKLHIGDGKNNRTEILGFLKVGESFNEGGFSITVEAGPKENTKTIRVN